MIKALLEWLTTKAKMPHYVWLGITFILVAIGIKILISNDLVIEANEELRLAMNTRKQAQEEKEAVEKITEDTIVELENIKSNVPPDAREVFSVAQMRIREDIKPKFNLPIEREGLHAAKK